MKKAQTEIVGLLLIVVLLVVGGMIYVTLNLAANEDTNTQRIDTYITSFITTYAATQTGTPCTTTLSNLAADAFTNTATYCNNPKQRLRTATNRILSETLETRYGDAYEFRIYNRAYPETTAQNITFQTCNASQKRGTAQPLYTDTNPIYLQVSICTQ